MATEVRAAANLITHDNFTAATTGGVRILPSRCNFVLIDNLDASISIKVSFDGGNKFKTVKAGTNLSLDATNITQLTIQSASSTVSVECLYGSEA